MVLIVSLMVIDVNKIYDKCIYKIPLKHVIFLGLVFKDSSWERTLPISRESMLAISHK